MNLAEFLSKFTKNVYIPFMEGNGNSEFNVFKEIIGIRWGVQTKQPCIEGVSRIFCEATQLLCVIEKRVVVQI